MREAEPGHPLFSLSISFLGASTRMTIDSISFHSSCVCLVIILLLFSRDLFSSFLATLFLTQLGHLNNEKEVVIKHMIEYLVMEPHRFLESNNLTQVLRCFCFRFFTLLFLFFFIALLSLSHTNCKVLTGIGMAMMEAEDSLLDISHSLIYLWNNKQGTF
jgi:hypothetical protein